MIGTILGAAGWVLAAFLAGWLTAGRRVSKKPKHKGAPSSFPTDQADATTQAQAERMRQEWQNFLNYDGRAQTLD